MNLWWLVPYVVLMLLMVHAMMELTVSFMTRHPPGRRKPITGAALRQRLLAIPPEKLPYPLQQTPDCDLKMCWHSEENQRAPWQKGQRSYSGQMRLLLDEQWHELRMNQVNRSAAYFLGWRGWLPCVWGFASASSGPPGEALTREIVRVAQRAGWAARPMLWWFETTYRGRRILATLTPAPLRRWPARRFWGILYPFSYWVGMGYLMAIIGGLDWHNGLLLLGISTVWWGFWGVFVWAMYGFRAFWRRRPS
jgi:hypothetical protein